MTIEGDGVVTEVSREYEPESAVVRAMSGAVAINAEDPALRSVTSAVASAAANAHNLNV